MSKHVLVKAQAICESTFFVESVDESTRQAYRDITCRSCLLRAITASEQRTQAIRELLAKLEEETP